MVSWNVQDAIGGFQQGDWISPVDWRIKFLETVILWYLFHQNVKIRLS